MKRTTLFLDDTLKEWLKGLSEKERRPQGEIIREALRNYIKKQGFNPNHRPRVKTSVVLL